jgi:hypothetical protein
MIVISSFIFSKLTQSYSYCNSYGEKDMQLGWVLKKSHESCLSFKNYLFNNTYFDTNIFLNQYGFRDKNTVNNKLPDIIFIGDSWTFGYGVNYEDTFAALIDDQTSLNVFNMGVPNYSSLQALYLIKRFNNNFNPKLIIFLNPEIMSRALCSKENYKNTLEPCYTIIDNEVEIVFPDGDFLNNSIAQNKYPSGFHTAGYNFYEYYFLYKPKYIFNKLLLKIGLKSNKYKPDVGANYFSKKELNLIKNKELNLISSLTTPNTKFINIMMSQNVYNANEIKKIQENYNFYNLNHEWYEKNINARLNKMENNGRIEKDGHYNEEANEIIAEAILNELNFNNHIK